MLQIAMQMEEIGCAFYKAIAADCAHKATADLCNRLARKEAEHLETFTDLRNRLTPETIQRELNQHTAAEFHDMIAQTVIPDAKTARMKAAGGELSSLLDTAVKMEKDSVLFYVRLLVLVPPEDATGILAIIDEEKAHIEEFTSARLELR